MSIFLLFRHTRELCLKPLINANNCRIKVALMLRRPLACTAATSREQPARPKMIHGWICGNEHTKCLTLEWGPMRMVDRCMCVLGNAGGQETVPTEVGEQSEWQDNSFFSVSVSPASLLYQVWFDFDSDINGCGERGTTCHFPICHLRKRDSLKRNESHSVPQRSGSTELE